jgi:hypothetical protein
LNSRPILLDTNLLVLFVVGGVSRDYIGKHKRLSQFTVEDYDLLLKTLSNAPSVLITPNILSETSNLLAHIAEPARSDIFHFFRSIIATSPEVYVASDVAAKRGEFIRLGLTDAAIVEASSQEVVVLTSDLNLYMAAATKGTPAINFNHLRDQYLI